MNWTWTEINIKKLRNDIKSGVMQIPTYQRGLVWEESKKEKLIETLRKGYPFGSILIYRYSTDEGEETLLIDGLQRCSTLFSFIEKPSIFFKFTDFEDEILDKIVYLVNSYYNPPRTRNVITNKIKKIIKTYLKDIDDYSKMTSMQYSKITKIIIYEFDLLKEKRDTVDELLEKLFSEFQILCENINSVVIPAIIYTGPSSDLAEIFTRINESGKSLDKYQRYAATWADSKIKITDDYLYKLVKITNDFYIHHLDKDSIQVKGFNSKVFLNESKLNVFELCYSFGKLISKECPALFGYTTNEKEIDAHGFNLINLSLGYHPSKMDNLNTHLLDIGDNNSIEQFLNRLMNAVKFVNKQVSDFNMIKGNKSKKYILKPVHQDFMILSMIASVFTNRYMDFEKHNSRIIKRYFNNNKSNENWNLKKSEFQKNLQKHYILEILKDDWMGSGDSSAYQIISENNQRYFSEISKENFSQTLQTWFDRDLNDTRRSGNKSRLPNPDNKERLLLNLTYLELFSAKDQMNDLTFDIEHLIPKNLLKQKLEYFEKYTGDEDLRLVPSNIGNLCYLPSEFNRSKKDRTIYDPSNKLEGNLTIDIIEEKYSFTNEDMFSFLEIKDWNKFKNGYSNFLQCRFKKIKETIINNIFNY